MTSTLKNDLRCWVVTNGCDLYYRPNQFDIDYHGLEGFIRKDGTVLFSEVKIGRPCVICRTDSEGNETVRISLPFSGIVKRHKSAGRQYGLEVDQITSIVGQDG